MRCRCKLLFYRGQLLVVLDIVAVEEDDRIDWVSRVRWNKLPRVSSSFVRATGNVEGARPTRFWLNGWLLLLQVAKH